MRPERIAMIGPAFAVSVPAMLVLTFPNMPIIPTANCPPSTGLANVKVGAENTRSPCEIRVQTDIDGWRKAADLNFSGCGHIAEGADRGVIIDSAKRPAGVVGTAASLPN